MQARAPLGRHVQPDLAVGILHLHLPAEHVADDDVAALGEYPRAVVDLVLVLDGVYELEVAARDRNARGVLAERRARNVAADHDGAVVLERARHYVALYGEGPVGRPLKLHLAERARAEQPRARPPGAAQGGGPLLREPHLAGDLAGEYAVAAPRLLLVVARVHARPAGALLVRVGVPLALLEVLVRLLYPLEPLRVPAPVRVVLQGEAAERGLHLLAAGAVGHAEYVVVALHLHSPRG